MAFSIGFANLGLPSSHQSVRQRPEGSGQLATLGTGEFEEVPRVYDIILRHSDCLAKDPAYSLEVRVLSTHHVFSSSKVKAWRILHGRFARCPTAPAATLSHSGGVRLAGRLAARSADPPLLPSRQARLSLPGGRRPRAWSLPCAAVFVRRQADHRLDPGGPSRNRPCSD